jgi:DNA-binding NarL/FixJ family response regulator
VVYVDVRALTRESIGRWLASRLDGFKVHMELNPEQAAVFAASNPQVALVLHHLSLASTSIETIADSLRAVVVAAGQVPVAVFADSEDPEVVTVALDCGVRGYIPTNMRASAVIEAVRLVCAGETYAPVSSLLGQTKVEVVLDSGLAQAPTDGFSARQQQILDCLRRGMANKQIAFRLGLSEATVKVHVRNLMRKLQVTNRTQVVLRTLAAEHKA